MTPARLRACLTLLGWTQRGLARLLERPEGTIRQWARGVVQIPADVDAWLEERAQHAARHPPPVRRIAAPGLGRTTTSVETAVPAAKARLRPPCGPEAPQH
jgi:transcriptional regulator with XRE-family HTH domain